ncbi:MAG: chromosome segregation protein ScpA [Solirubrobacterales bacterium]|nr:chromosome segregation protein ScpA [Solirubrobacterales bacterium]
MASVSELELDLDGFQGPFDLLLAVLLRQEISLADVELGEIVVAYVEHLDESGQIELESVTEFLVLIAALLELKSRLLLPTEPDDEDLTPEEAADELLARMLEYRRYSQAAGELAKLFEAEGGYLYRSAPLPPELRRAALDAAVQVYEPDRLGSALGDLLQVPASVDTRHIRNTVSLHRRLSVLREMLAFKGTIDFDEAFGNEDRFTQAVTLFALLEMHRRGEASWTQKETFGPIEVTVK